MSPAARWPSRRAAYRALGGFDAGFWPVYFEDVDLCTRAWDAGYSVWYIPAAVATHAESASLAHGGPAYFRYYHRNRLRYVLRHYAARPASSASSRPPKKPACAATSTPPTAPAA